MNTKTYPLKIDESSYNTLKSICEVKNITIKDGLTAAIGLLIAHNMNLVEIKGKTKKSPQQLPKRNSVSHIPIEPIFHEILRSLVKTEPNIHFFTFSCWVEHGNDHFCPREYRDAFDISNQMNFMPDDVISSKKITLWIENEEFAMKSLVEVKRGTENKVMHVPMIDFEAGTNWREAINGIMFIINELWKGLENAKVFLLKTDSSYHAYFDMLMEEDEYMAFLEEIKTANEETKVDTFWVTASLKRGYSCLRWTANSKYYMSAPQYASIITNQNVEL
jgi:hypothetical protein